MKNLSDIYEKSWLRIAPDLPAGFDKKSAYVSYGVLVSGISFHKSGVKKAYVCMIAEYVALAKLPNVVVDPRHCV